MGKNLLSSLGAKLSQLKVMCGLSVDSSAKEEKAVAAVRRDPIPSARFLHVLKQRKHDQQLSTEFKVSGCSATLPAECVCRGSVADAVDVVVVDSSVAILVAAVFFVRSCCCC